MPASDATANLMVSDGAHSKTLCSVTLCCVLRFPRHGTHRCISDFVLVKEIGNGAVSTVFYALCKRSCLRVAIKIYTKSKLTKLNARQVRDGHGVPEDAHGPEDVMEDAQ